MDDNKTVPTTDDPGYTYKDITESTTREIAETPPVEEKKEEPVVETPTPTPPVEEPKLSEEDAAKIAEEAAKKVLEEQEAAHKAQEPPPTPEDPKTEYQNIVKDFQDKEGRVPTWDELAVKIEERTLQKLEEKQQEQVRVYQEEQARAKKAEEAEVTRVNNHIDEELADLYATNKLSPIKDPKNPSDQGVVERKALFQAMMDVNIKRREEGKDPIGSVKLIYYEHYQKPTAQPPGADLPVMNNRGSVNPTTEQTYTYADLKKPWTWLAKKS